MKKSQISDNLLKMDITIWSMFLKIILLITGAASVCVHVPNREMIEYACTGGSPSDLYAIPENAEKIRITNMTVGRINDEMFSRYGENLWVLICTRCNINYIEPNAFKSLVNLQQLRLDDNHLRDVKSAWFVGMRHLTYLDLNYNEIERIEDGVYDNLPSLVDFRISGNRLECLNIDAMSDLVGLERIFLSKNPDFKCPNAVSKFLEDRKITFEKDPEWKSIVYDMVSPGGQSSDWRSHSINRDSTPTYQEKLISRTTTEDSVDYYIYDTISPNFSNQNSQAGSNSPIFTTTRAPYLSENWPVSVPTNYDQTPPGGPILLPNSYLTRDWQTTSESSYYPETRPIPTSTYSSRGNRPEWQPSPTSSHDRDETDRKPETTVTSSIDRTYNEPMTNVNFPPYVQSGVEPIVFPTNDNLLPPHVEWSNNSTEIFTEIEYPRVDNTNSIVNSAQTNSPSVDIYSSNVHSPIGRPTTFPDIYNQPPQNSNDFSKPKIVDKFQQVQEPSVITVFTQAKETTDKPLPDCSASGVIGASFEILTIAIVLSSLVNTFYN